MYIPYTLWYDSYKDYDKRFGTKVIRIIINLSCYYVAMLAIGLNSKGKMNTDVSNFYVSARYLMQFLNIINFYKICMIQLQQKTNKNQIWNDNITNASEIKWQRNYIKRELKEVTAIHHSKKES